MKLFWKFNSQAQRWTGYIVVEHMEHDIVMIQQAKVYDPVAVSQGTWPGNTWMVYYATNMSDIPHKDFPNGQLRAAKSYAKYLAQDFIEAILREATRHVKVTLS